jgi:hypothetical protein
MDQINEIRRQKHIDYLKKNWYPHFVNKYKSVLPILKLQRYLKHHRFLIPKNLSSNEIKLIPGIYRLRLQLSDNNLKFPSTQPLHSIPQAHTDYPFISDFDRAILESNKDVEQSFDIQLSQAIQDSLNYNNNDEDLDEYLLNQALIESMKQTNNNNGLHNTFTVLLDLRIYGNEPTKPIIVDNKQYFLNNDQIQLVKTTWNKINHVSDASIKFYQTLELIKNVAKDINTDHNS